MSEMTREQWKSYVGQWKETGAALEKIHREELRNLKYDYFAVDALLELGDLFGKSRPTSGMVEMQRYFMKRREKLEK